MADATGPVSPNVLTFNWNEDDVFFAVGDPIRRRILLSLARSGPQAAFQLVSRTGRTSTATLKQLALMRDAGLVIMKDNPNDGRKSLYQLSPNVPLTKTEKGAEIDFGFCLLRL